MGTSHRQTETPPKTPCRTPRKKRQARLTRRPARFGKADGLDVYRSPAISLKPAFQKQRHFERLLELERMYHKSRDPSAARIRIAIEHIREMMATNWSLLIIRCRFQESVEEYWKILHKADVFAVLLRLLDVHSTITDASTVKQRLDIDTEWFEDRFINMVRVMHERAMRHIHYRNCEKPDSWTQEEADQWRKFEDVLSDKRKGKIVVKEWLAEGVREFMDPTRIVIEDDVRGEVEIGEVDVLRNALQSLEDTSQ